MAFKYFDTDNSGYITIDNLAGIFEASGKSISKDQIAEIIKEVDIR